MSDKIINIDSLKYYNDKINQTKQDTLISGTNIKTINGESIIGSGNIEIIEGNPDANIMAVDTGDVLDDVNIEYATKGELAQKQDKLVSGTNIKTINGESILGSGDINIMVPITWSELKNMRDNSSLVPGTRYRITDYVTTTSQGDTRSANHPFDVVVLATGTNTLSEEARVVRHPKEKVTGFTLEGFPDYWFLFKEAIMVDNVEWFMFEAIIDGSTGAVVSSYANPTIGDTVYFYDSGTITTETFQVFSIEERENEYFFLNNVNLDAWKIWYCIDNDQKRFPWALTITNKRIVTSPDGSTNFIAEYNGTFDYNDNIYHRWDCNDYEQTISFLTLSDTPSVNDTISFYGIIYTGEMYEIYEYGGVVKEVKEPSNDEGFGVIYRMIDEQRNDCPYDFKNIQFLVPITDGLYDENGTTEYVFTFNLNDGSGTASMDYSNTTSCTNNIIKPCVNGLNFNIFLNKYRECSNNVLNFNCAYNLFIDGICNCNAASNVQDEIIYYNSSLFGRSNEVRIAYNSNNNLKIYCEDNLADIEVDTAMSSTSTNPVRNNVIKNYIDSNCNIKVATTTASSKSLNANTYYKWTNILTNITITLVEPTNTNILNNYMFEFTTGSDGCTLSVPSSIKWLNGIPPIIEPNTTYQISIINNLATIAKFV